MSKIIAKVSDTIRIVEKDGYFKIQEVVTPDGLYIEWVTCAFRTIESALQEITNEFQYRATKDIQRSF